jgi:DNA-binding MarR family transcriptional regulator
MPTVAREVDTMTKAEVKPGKVIGAAAGFVGAMTQATGDSTMGAQQLLLLMALYIHGELNQIDLPRYTGVEKSANSRNLARLGEGSWVDKGQGKRHEPGLGLVEGYDEPTDRRIKKVRLTPKGRVVLEEAAKQAALFLV